MRTFVHRYKKSGEWVRFLETLPSGYSGDATLVQLFASVDEDAFLDEVAQRVHQAFPDAAIIGATTAGEIVNGRLVEGEVVVAVSFFEKSVVRSAAVTHEESYALGSRLAQRLSVRNPTVAILFADGIRHNADVFLQGFTNTMGLSIPIHGGMAADNMRFEKTKVLHGDRWIEGGAVGVVIESLSLQIVRNYHLSWKAVGRKMRVTKAEGNRVWQIDGKPIVEVYREYLGICLDKRFPEIGALFPLLMEYEGVTVARAMTSVREDGSITFAGNVPQGSEVRFGIGNSRWFTEDTAKTMQRLKGREVESIFIYSCAARKTFLGDEISKEFEELAGVAPTVGFFTYGEFYTVWNVNRALNITTTVLAMNESGSMEPARPVSEPADANGNPENMALKALIHLINKLEEECESSRKER